MFGQEERERKPMSIWARGLVLIALAMLLCEAVFQINNAYLRYKLRPMMQEAISKASAPSEAAFDYQSLPIRCLSYLDSCLSAYLDPKYERVFMDHVPDKKLCQNPNNKFCPVNKKMSLQAVWKTNIYIGLFSNEIDLSIYTINDESY